MKKKYSDKAFGYLLQCYLQDCEIEKKKISHRQNNSENPVNASILVGLEPRDLGQGNGRR